MGGMVFGWLLWVVALVVIVALAWWGFNSRASAFGSGRAEEILKERYAKGEIDHETYQRMLNDIRTTPQHP